MRRFALLGVFLLAVSTAALVACGEASLNLSTPTPTPSGEIDCTFSGGVREAFATRDCGNSGCHVQPGVAQLTLVPTTMSDDEVYRLLLDSGGTTQRNSACGGEAPECATNAGSPPAGGYCCNRTVRPNQPGYSLLLQKPNQDNPITHGGGKQFSAQDPAYQAVKCWIEAGAPND